MAADSMMLDAVCMAAARWHPEAPRQTEQLGVSGYASSGSSRAGPEHRGVTEHVSPGCSATGPQQLCEEKARSPAATWLGDPVPAVHVSGEDRSRGHIGSVVPPQHRADMLCMIEFSLISGEKACCDLEWTTSMVQIWRHLRLWDVVGKYERVQLVVGKHVYEEVMIKEDGGGYVQADMLLDRADDQFRATGVRSGEREWSTRVLRMTVVRSGDNPKA